MISKSLSAVRYELETKKVMAEYKKILCQNQSEINTRLLKINQECRVSKFALLVYLVNKTENIKLRPNQIACGLALFDNKFVELATGEGKTYSIILSALARGLDGAINVVTVNNYLAYRDYKICSRIASRISLQVYYADEATDISIFSVKKGIIYSSAQTLIFAYLSDGYFYNEKRIFSSLDSVIIDEVDYVLVDNAVSSFSVGIKSDRKSNFYVNLYRMSNQFVSTLTGTQLTDSKLDYKFSDSIKTDYIFNREMGFICLTKFGIKKLENIFNIDTSNLKDADLDLYTAILSSLRANFIFEKGKHYTVVKNQLVMINQHNGRLSINSKFDDTLQLALEVKESCFVSERTLLENRISYQSFFLKFNHISGLSGTVSECSDELYTVFCTDTVVLNPTSKSKVKVLKDIHCTSSSFEQSVVNEINLRTSSHPVLIICPCEKSAISLYSSIKEYVECELLIPTNENRENELIEYAGKVGSVLISTIMSTRGTDIKTSNRTGLFVLACFHSRNSRVDRQIIGRTARNGGNGSVRFIYEDTKGILSTTSKYSPSKYSKIQENIGGIEYNQRASMLKVDILLDSLKMYSSNLLDLIKSKNSTGLYVYCDKTVDYASLCIACSKESILYEQLEYSLVLLWSDISKSSEEYVHSLNYSGFLPMFPESRFIEIAGKSIKSEIDKLLVQAVRYSLNCTVKSL